MTKRFAESTLTNKTAAKTIRVLINLALALFAIAYIYWHYDDLQILLTVNWQSVALLGGVTVLNSLATAAQAAVFYRAIGAPLTVLESFGLSILGSGLSLIIPQANVIVKAVYLKKRYAIPYAKTPVVFLGNLIIFLFVGACLILINNVVAIFAGITIPWILWAVAIAAMTSVMLLVVKIPEDIFSRLGRIGRMLTLFSEGWTALRANRIALFSAAFYQCLIFISGGLIVAVSYYALGLTVHPILGVSIAVFVSFSNIVLITPGNFGVQEAIYGYLSLMTGFLFAHGVAASALMRAVGLAETALLAAPAWYFLFFRRNLSIRSGRME